MIADSGLGLSEEDMVNNLGTIARSGSKAFVNEVSLRGRAVLCLGWVGLESGGVGVGRWGVGVEFGGARGLRVVGEATPHFY